MTQPLPSEGTKKLALDLRASFKDRCDSAAKRRSLSQIAWWTEAGEEKLRRDGPAKEQDRD